MKSSNTRELQLIMESWRQYTEGCVEENNYGNLYLFENDAVSSVSFYDKINTLAESETSDDVNLFFEQWEKSAHYTLDNKLNEISWEGTKELLTQNPLLLLAKQALEMLKKWAGQIKDKMISIFKRVTGVIDKMKGAVERFKEKHPWLYKIILAMIAIVAVILVILVVKWMIGAAAAGATISGMCTMNESKNIITEGCLVGRSGETLATEDELKALGGWFGKEGQSATEQSLGAEFDKIASSVDDVSNEGLSGSEAFGSVTVREAERTAKKMLPAMYEACDDYPGAAGFCKALAGQAEEAVEAAAAVPVENLEKSVTHIQNFGMKALQAVPHLATDPEGTVTKLQQLADEGNIEALKNLSPKMWETIKSGDAKAVKWLFKVLRKEGGM